MQHLKSPGIFAKRLYSFLMVTALLLGTSFFTHAQTAGTASIQGTVTDPTGAAIANAKVTFTNTGTHASRTTATDGSGIYSLPNIPVGAYSLSIAAPGFQGYTRTGVLEVGNNIQVNPALTIGSSTEQVEVQASGATLETETSSFKQVIDQKSITELPLNGRQATQLILVSGGAVTAPSGDLVGSKNYASSTVIAVAGGQGNYNNYVLDGGNNVDVFTNVNLPYPFPDALREFSVESNSLPARNGLHPGSLVNGVTNSGTNQWHGTVFDFIRNNYLNATNFFSTKKDTLHRNQFGGTVGGKILTDKLFFFGGYQGTREAQSSNATQDCIPTAAELTGDFSQMPTTGSCAQAKITGSLVDPSTGATINTTNPSAPDYRKIPTSSISPQAVALAKLLPNSQANSIGLIQVALPAIDREDQYIGRVDFALNQKHSVFFRAFVTNYFAPAFYQPNNLLLTTTAGNDERVMNYTLGDTYILSARLVNTFHGSYARRRDNRGPTAGGINATDVGVNIYNYVPADFRLSVSNNFSIGCGTCSPGFFNTNTEDFTDDVDYLLGKHQIAFGAEYMRAGQNSNAGYLQNGNFSFNGGLSGINNKNVGEPLIDFLTGQQNAFSQSRAQLTNYRQNIYGVYVQDTFHATQRLTLSAGVRWEPYLVPTDQKARGSSFSQTAFDANQHSTVYPLGPAGSFYYGDPGIPKSYAHNSMARFSPRLGLTLDPAGNGKTVFRFGGAIMYDSPGLFALQRMTSNPPVVNEIDLTGQISFANPWGNYPGGNPFPGIFPPNASSTFPAGSLYIVTPLNVKTPVVDQWTASVQQDLGHGWTFSLNYLGNKNTHLWLGNSPNAAVYIPGTWTGVGTCGALTTSPGNGKPCSSTTNTANRTRLVLENPTQGAFYNVGMTKLYDGGNSSYNGVIAAVQHRMSKDFSFLANYTWSHCISNGDANGDVTGPSFENPADPNMDRANCGFDVRHIFNTTFIASSHFSSLHGWAGALVNNWQIAPLVRVLSGAVLNVTTGTDNSLTGVALDRPNLVNAQAVYSHKKITQLAAGNRQYLSAKTAGAFAANATGTFGTLGRNAFRQPNYYDVDAAITRTFPVYDRVNFNLRFEGFNVLNHPNFNGFTTALNSSQFGFATKADSARIFQLAGKFTF
ncbi:MAG TPA: carboxypeptidase regulatory-like domain-containing protein [Edaphobacter sp.]|uniref:carboxypeptidase regulatory-like domain-containing protein n=1 Tax=Edaphobacter sp. TaxID=1934404 RepID=UPI002C5ED908|nr:carboxypeptidase regulatory-like domain-containing protein [Edaphobacter sp.]HUZ94073.1 carboxypeptidase regulatory-like domain-containing protein [Edaphobacter sp.]